MDIFIALILSAFFTVVYIYLRKNKTILVKPKAVKKDDKCPCLVLYCYLIIKHSRLLSAYGRFYKPDGGCYGKIRPRAGA